PPPPQLMLQRASAVRTNSPHAEVERRLPFAPRRHAQARIPVLFHGNCAWRLGLCPCLRALFVSGAVVNIFHVELPLAVPVIITWFEVNEHVGGYLAMPG